MDIQQIGLSYSENMGLMMSNNIFDFRHLIDQKRPSFIPMANLDSFALPISHLVPRLEVGNHGE